LNIIASRNSESLQLCCDAHATACFADRAFEDVANAEFASDLFQFDCLALVSGAGVCGQ
jgi:hypothetical protein